MAEALGTVKEIDRDELKAQLDMPPKLVNELAPLIVPDKHTPLITYCAGPACHASLDAARELHALGYTNVRHYPGGTADWMTARFPVERGE